MKKMICILLVLLLLAGCGAPAASTQPQTTAATELTAVCGGETLTFAPWEGEGLPAEGCYFLTGDVMLEACVTVTGKLQLHLNGHTIQSAETPDMGQMFAVPAGGELTIVDEAGGMGKVVAPRAFTAKPCVLHMFRVEGTLTIAGGTLDASAISLENISNGAVFCVNDGGVVNVEGGLVQGGTTLCYSLDPAKNIPADVEPADTPTGEATEPAETVATEPVTTEPATTEPVATEPEQPLELFGKGGVAYVAPGGVLNISGGVLQGGEAGLGGSIYLETHEEKPGTLNMTGGTIAGGMSMFHGGNIYIAGAANISGGEIAEGKAYNHGGNLAVEGALNMTGGVIRDGECGLGGLAGKRGGNILVNGLNATVSIANAEILGGIATNGEGFGGNISVIGQCAREFSVENTLIADGMGHRGGNMYFGTLAKDVNMDNLDFYMKDVTVRNGTCSYRGANVCMDSDLRGIYVNLVMDNSTLLLEENSKENISLGAGAAPDTWATLTMNGGAIEGGSLMLYMDSVLTANGTRMTQQEQIDDGRLVINP